MIEVKDINDMIDKFPMYLNVSLPKDIATIMDNAYVSLLVYRDRDKDSHRMYCNEDVYFIEDSESVRNYFSNIFFEQGKKAMVFKNINEAIHEEIDPKMFFIDMSAVVEHKNLLKLMDTYPEAKIILISGIAKYIICFIEEMQRLREGIVLDFVLSRNSEVILSKIKEVEEENDNQ